MIDKIILALLVLALPVTAFLTNRYLANSQPEGQEEVSARIDQLLKTIENKAAQEGSKIPEEEISLNTVFHATESGVLQVTGFAPRSNVQLMLSAVPIESVESEPEDASQSADTVVLGKAVEVRAIPVTADKVFTFEYPVEDDWKQLELRLEQGQASKTVIYHFETGKFEQL